MTTQSKTVTVRGLALLHHFVLLSFLSENTVRCFPRLLSVSFPSPTVLEQAPHRGQWVACLVHCCIPITQQFLAIIIGEQMNE